MRSSTETMPRIALIVDNPYRDLPGLVLTAWQLCQSGATCYLVPLNLQWSEVWSLAPGFVLLNYLRKNNEALAQRLLKVGIQVGVLDTEGGIFSPVPTTARTTQGGSTPNGGATLPALEGYTLTMAQDAQVRHSVACYCAWASVFADYASRAGWYTQEQITVTGTPRIDFYAPRWREAAQRISAYADIYPAPLIMVAGSFPLANPCFQTPEQEAEMLIKRFSYSRDFVEKWQRTQSEAMRGLAALANHLARRFPDVTLVYRPHPFEGMEAYNSLLEPLPNLHAVKQGTVDGWLLRAKAMIQWGSSTAVEAGLLGVPAFTAGWLPVHLPVPAVDAISIACPTLEVLTEHVAAVLQNHFTIPSAVTSSLQRVIEDTFYQMDGCAHQRVAKAILAALEAGGCPLQVDACYAYFYGINGTERLGREKVKRLLFTVLGSHLYSALRRAGTRRDAPRLWDNSDKHFDAAGVQQIVAAIEAVASTGQAVSVMPGQESGAYHFGYQQGRAVMMRLAQ